MKVTKLPDEKFKTMVIQGENGGRIGESNTPSPCTKRELEL